MKLAKLIILFLILTLSYSCKTYRPTEFSADELLQREDFQANIPSYIYVLHTGDSAINLTNTKLSEGSLTGKVSANKIDLEENVSRKEKKKTVHIYLEPEAEKYLAKEMTSDSTISLDQDDIKQVNMYSKRHGGLLGIVLTALAVFGSLLLLTIILLIGAALTSNSGGSSSGGGGGGGGSSCYVATMTYGSYDAPEVLVLRKFRDQVLVNFQIGRRFISWYYAHSPKFVEQHQDKKWIHSTCRAVLTALVRLLKVLLK